MIELQYTTCMNELQYTKLSSITILSLILAALYASAASLHPLT